MVLTAGATLSVWLVLTYLVPNVMWLIFLDLISFASTLEPVRHLFYHVDSFSCGTNAGALLYRNIYKLRKYWSRSIVFVLLQICFVLYQFIDVQFNVKGFHVEL